MLAPDNKPKVVIIGGGFGGLYAAQVLGRAGFPVTLIDRTNYHLFQPLLYQVATGALAPGDIAAPLRSVLSGYPTATVLQAKVKDIDPVGKKIITNEFELPFEILIVAAGVTHSYFGHPEWEADAPGLKRIEDSIKIRSRILRAFELAEKASEVKEREKLLTFAIVGGGPTGVELAGAIGELAHHTMRGEFRNFDLNSVRILLCEGGARILPQFSEKSSIYATWALKRLKVSVWTNTKATPLGNGQVEISQLNKSKEIIEVGTIIWAAGVQASPLAKVLANNAGASLDDLGRVKVQADLSLNRYPNIFVIGDLAAVPTLDGKTLPGVAPVAIQEGQYVANLLVNSQVGKNYKAFRYRDKGNMAVIGKGRAVAETWKFRLTGLSAWLAWAVIHIYFLIEFENKLVVFIQWSWNYLTNRRGSRLITASETNDLP